MGPAIARTFGSRGFDVALIARTKETLVDQLGREGIEAAAFPVDVMDRAWLTAALDAAKDHFGGIDALEDSPAPHFPVPGHRGRRLGGHGGQSEAADRVHPLRRRRGCPGSTPPAMRKVGAGCCSLPVAVP